MKLLTINTHSLIEDNYRQKLETFVKVLSEEIPDIIALQEANQSQEAEIVPESNLAGYCPCKKTAVIRQDNHVYNTVRLLRKCGVNYYWTWLPLKCGYGKYDEGIAVMSREPIAETNTLLVSNADDYSNWKTRRLLGISTVSNPDEWFYSVHFGWWDDEQEPFEMQWKKTDAYMKKHHTVWLMGDFNNPAQIQDEGYDMIRKSGWHDSYTDAENKDNGITVKGVIDGWRNKISSSEGMRIDHIWSGRKEKIRSCRVVFNGKEYPVISDHYGVMIEYERTGL